MQRETDKKNCGNPVKEKIEKGRSCAVERLSARDHLVTGESEGHEEPLGSDGTTRHGRGKKWRAEDPGWLWKPVSVLFLLPAETAYFRVPFTCLWIGLPGSPVRKASTNVRECPGLSRRLLKCTRSPCSHVRAFASDCRVMNSNPDFGWGLSCREPVGQNGVLTLSNKYCVVSVL
ncbi:hypothetical protein CRG98_015690 [Punica granatum]|uniref:Uncharacterized protein n=1 Tax=Punica granatum TaxID=22663 RepID=A0A2I0K5T8_PUNGR|nr:hypothetical protein CRG98_015690 [Punica granatum]